MKIAIIDKDQFAGLLRYGEIILPNYSISRISDDLPEKEAIKLILSDGNPIEFPSQYIILRFESEDDKLKITSVKSLMATDAESLKLFSMQFRQDLFIQPAEYSDIFSEYLQNTLQKNKILKGIISFRTLCGLDISGDYSDYVNMIYQGINNRLKYRHHYQLPPEEREKPYSLMISYDRHSPYPKGWTGYYCDVIEVYCYYDKPDLGYSDAIAENTKIYESIIKTGPNAKSKEINEAIKNENFVKKCNEFFNLPGGYLVPYIFFILDS